MMEVNSVQWTSKPEERRGAWARVFLDNLDGFVLVRTSRQSGTRRITGMVIMPGAADDPAQVLKDLPVSRIEFFLRQLPELPSEVETVHTDGATELFRDPLAESIFGEWNRAEGRKVLPEEADLSEEDKLRAALPFVQPAESARPKRTPLSRPDKSGDDGFYRQVATAYIEVMGHTRAVAPALADEAGVPVRTVHRWVAEARRRGFLPAASKGRA